MKKSKKQIALNKLFNFCMIICAFILWLSIECFVEGDLAWGIGCGIVALITFIIPAIFTPYCYAFDKEGVSLCYIFLPVERYLWKDIRSIEATIDYFCSKANIFEFFYAFVFSIEGKNVGKTRFYMQGHIRKSFRTKRLLTKYWDGTITGYLFEDVKKWVNKRKNKRQTHIEAHKTDEIVKMEREIRSKTREFIKPYIDLANKNNLDFKVKYIYITKDFEELNSRPKEGYTYTLIAEISHFNEKDENRIVLASVDLIYVRLGRTAYLGVLNNNIEEEIKVVFGDVLNEIIENGIEVYCKNN